MVTGAAGFIGSKLAKSLLMNGHHVVTIDNLRTGQRGVVPKDAEFIEGDCQNESVIAELYRHDFDAIFHIAGQSSGEISFDDPVYDLQTNTQSTLMLLNYAKEKKVKSFIYASSMSVYGNCQFLPVNEDSMCDPISFYAIGKIASEKYLRVYNQNYGINTVALRLFNVYGPGQNLNNLRQGLVSIFLAQAINHKHILIKGDKNRFRDFVYIDDVVNAFMCSLKHRGFAVYNVSSNKKVTIEEVVKLIGETLPFDFTVEYRGKTFGDMFGIYGDYSKINQALGWKPEYYFSEGFGKMAVWAQKVCKAD